MSDNKPILTTLVVVILGIAAMVGYFVFSADPEEQRVTEIAIPEQQPAEIPQPMVEPEPEEEKEGPPPIVLPEPDEKESEPAFVLPLLNDSDPLIRDGVVSLTRHEGINIWLGPSELLRKFVAFVDNIAHGQVAKEPVRSLAPEGQFLATRIGEESYQLDPASYDRYNTFTEIAISVDARRAAEFYHLLKPLIQNAYNELGYGEKPFDDVLFQAIGRLLETPVIDEPIMLERPVVMYKFADPKLESLSAAQKQMIRMGPRNTRLLQAKISEVALELRAILEND